MKKISLLLLCLMFSACQNSKEEKKATYSYELEQNNCATGRHEFKSQEELCVGLQDEALNKSCARGLRQQYFNTQCPGRVFQDEQPPAEEEITIPENETTPEPPTSAGGTTHTSKVTLRAGESLAIAYRMGDRLTDETNIRCLAAGIAAEGEFVANANVEAVMLSSGSTVFVRPPTGERVGDQLGTYIQFECR